MNTTELLAQFRRDLNDVEEPYLWSDEEVFGYMNDAQQMFCRLIGGLGDASSALTQIAYDPSSDWVALSPLILHVRSAADDATGRPIDVWNEQDMHGRGIRFTRVPSRVRALVIGLEANRARLYAYPAQAGVIQLSVERLPLLELNDLDQPLEIDMQHHAHLGMWMAYRACSKQDAETFDRTKAAESKLAFEQYCFDAKAERERARGKRRVVAYGGI